MAKLCLVRHGETDWNAERRIQGQIDVALNARGRAQARALGAVLSGTAFSAAYSSDLGRAWDTAVAARPSGMDIQPEPALRERHYGIFQGLTHAEAEVGHPQAYARFRRRDPDYGFEHGESLSALASRVRACLARLAERHRGGTVFLATHGGVLDIARRLAAGKPLDAPRDFEIPNAGINWIESDGRGGWRLLAWAQVEHLEELDVLDENAG